MHDCLLLQLIHCQLCRPVFLVCSHLFPHFSNTIPLASRELLMIYMSIRAVWYEAPDSHPEKIIKTLMTMCISHWF